VSPEHTGWKCPGCGRCYAPAVTECAPCNAFAAQAQLPLPLPVIIPPFVWPSGATSTPPEVQQYIGQVYDACRVMNEHVSAAYNDCLSTISALEATSLGPSRSCSFSYAAAPPE
jgi:hypothetical protein